MVAGPAKSTRFRAVSLPLVRVSALRSSQMQDVLIAYAEQKLDITVNLSTWLSRPAANHNSARAHYSRRAACYLLYFAFFE